MEFFGEIVAFIAAILWSFTALIFSRIQAQIGSVLLNFIRLLLASLLLLGTISIIGGSWDLSFIQLFYLTMSGAIGLVIGDMFLFMCYPKVGERIAMLVHSSNPALAAILAFLILNETLTLWSIVGIVITLTGIYVVILEKNHKNGEYRRISKIGIFYAAIAALGQAVGLIFVKLAFNIGPIDGFVATFIRIFSSVILMLPIIYFKKNYRITPRNILSDKKLVRLILIGVIIGPYLGISLSIISIIHAKVGIASTLMSTSPIIMLPLAYFINKEKLGIRAIIGATVAVIGVSLLFVN